MNTTILSPTTAAAYSQQFSSGGGSFNISCVGLGANETAILRSFDFTTNTWNDLQRNGGNYALMSAGNNNINILLENGLYCLYKTATILPVAISIQSQPFSVIFNGQDGA